MKIQKNIIPPKLVNRSYAQIGILLFLLLSCVAKQKPDKEFNVSVDKPFFSDRHPLALFDETHYNSHTMAGTYSPFVNLITNDGFVVRSNHNPFSNTTLDHYSVLIISNAKGGETENKHLPAFTSEECLAVRNWVSGGGGLLLIADHYPMGSASEILAQQFGVHMFNGETSDSVHYERGGIFKDKLVFSRQNKLLDENEITNNLERVVSDRGQSLSIPENAIVLLRLSKTSYHFLPDSIWKDGGSTYTRFQGPFSAYGNCQGLALKYGKGRVVILGEAAMITAQVFDGEKFGMNTPGNQNKQFALNIMRWLATKE